MTYLRKLFAATLASALLLASSGLAAAQDFLYGATGTGGGTGQLVRIDPTDGSFVIIGDLNDVLGNNYRLTGMAYDANTGIMYGSANNQSPTNPRSLVTVNLANGLVTYIGDFNVSGQSLADLTFSGGTLYGWAEPSFDSLASVNLATGQATMVGSSGLNTYGAGTAADSSGTIYFAGDGNSGRLLTIDSSDSSWTFVADLSGAPGNLGNPISALAFDSSDVLFGTTMDFSSGTNAFLITIDTNTGAITTIGQTIDRLDAIAFVPIPEPASLVLVSIAGVGMLAVTRRKFATKRVAKKSS